MNIKEALDFFITGSNKVETTASPKDERGQKTITCAMKFKEGEYFLVFQDQKPVQKITVTFLSESGDWKEFETIEQLQEHYEKLVCARYSIYR